MRRLIKKRPILVLVVLNLSLPVCLAAAAAVFRFGFPTSFKLMAIARSAQPWQGKGFFGSTRDIWEREAYASLVGRFRSTADPDMQQALLFMMAAKREQDEGGSRLSEFFSEVVRGESVHPDVRLVALVCLAPGGKRAKGAIVSEVFESTKDIHIYATLAKAVSERPDIAKKGLLASRRTAHWSMPDALRVCDRYLAAIEEPSDSKDSSGPGRSGGDPVEPTDDNTSLP